MRLTAPLGLGLTILVLGLGWTLVPWGEVMHWAALHQRAFQNAMARALRAIQMGDPAATVSLCLATTAYGFVHALGPGHGKVLLGGAAMATGATLRRMAALTIASSLAQSASAILLVAGLLGVVKLTSADAIGLTEEWLAPISYVAIGGIGAVLFLRGIKATHANQGDTDPKQSAHDACSCGHAHGPTMPEVRSVGSRREAAVLIASIAIRPCTGALFLLVIAARFDVFATGMLAVVAMGLGTATFNLVVASSGVAAYHMAHLGAAASRQRIRSLTAALHLMGGGAIVCFSVILVLPHLG